MDAHLVLNTVQWNVIPVKYHHDCSNHVHSNMSSALAPTPRKVVSSLSHINHVCTHLVEPWLSPLLSSTHHPHHAASRINTGTDELFRLSSWFPRVLVKEITPAMNMQKGATVKWQDCGPGQRVLARLIFQHIMMSSQMLDHWTIDWLCAAYLVVEVRVWKESWHRL